MLCGRTVTGDVFIEQDGRESIIERFDPICCDMETAAAAHVCHAMGVSFNCVRAISDTEDEAGLGSFEKTWPLPRRRPLTACAPCSAKCKRKSPTLCLSAQGGFNIVFVLFIVDFAAAVRTKHLLLLHRTPRKCLQNGHLIFISTTASAAIMNITPHMLKPAPKLSLFIIPTLTKTAPSKNMIDDTQSQNFSFSSSITVWLLLSLADFFIVLYANLQAHATAFE